MEKHHAGAMRPGNDFDLLAALGADLPGAIRVVPSEASLAVQPVRKEEKTKHVTRWPSL
jgi:serine/threonine-protein kinase HipA